MSKITRRALLASTAAVALAGQATAGVFPRGGGPVGGAPPATLTTVVVSNTGPGALAGNSYVRFGHPFGPNDLASGRVLTITDDLSSSVPNTAMARSTAGGSSVRFADIVARLPNGMAAPLNISSITHSGTTATVTTASAHSLSTGAVVNIYGAQPDDYVGAYTITVTGSSTFTYVMPTTPASNATTPGQMLYTRVLTLTSANGSWSNTLPNSKTPTNIITDITTNFDNLTLTLSNVTNSSGSTIASGTFNADLQTALAATPPAGQLRTISTRQGQLVCDICALMKFNDNTTPSTHLGSMSAWFYVTAFLDQTTGAVQELRARVWIDNSLANVAMDYITYNATLKLGSTVVRSTGLSSTLAIDGKLQTFAPSAVNTSTNVINLPNHGFQGGETVRFTTTGTLPSGLATATDYPVIWVDGSNIAIGGTFNENNQLGNSSYLGLGTQGSGTHTVKCWLHSPYRSRQAYVGNNGLPDRWTGKTGAFAPQGDYVVHNNTYLQTTKMVPPVDLTVNLSTKAAFVVTLATSGTDASLCNLDRFVFGALGTLQYHQNDGGAGGFHEYGGPWTDKPLRRLRYCSDPGFAQTLRVDALMMCGFDVSLINDDTLWRMPCVNNGPARNGIAYTGLPTPAVNSCFGGTFQVGFTSATSYKLLNGASASYSFGHRYILLERLYLFEGGQDVHDMVMMDANATILGNTPGASVTFPTTAQISAKNYSISGTTYYTWINGSEQRADAWTVQVYEDAKFLGDDGCVEKPYIMDLGSDWIFVANWLNNTFAPSVNSTYNIVGGWQYGEAARNGPGNAYATQSDSITGFFQSYIGMTWGHCARMDSTNTTLGTLMGSFYGLVDALYRQTAGNGAFGNTYGIRCMQAGDSGTNSTQTISAATAPMIEDSNLQGAGGGVAYRTDGVVIGCSNGAVVDTIPVNGDVHYLTDTFIDGTIAPGAYSGPPSANMYGTYTVTNASGTYQGGWKYSGVASYAAFNSNTLSAAITTVGQTTITTTSALAFPANPNMNNLVIVDTEIMLVTAGQTTTTLTVTRGAFGTTAATHLNGATIYVPFTSMIYGDYQNRVVAFPPTGHAYRITGSAAAVPDGYLTMMRSQAFYGYLLGKIAKTAFNNADAWFNDSTAPAGCGPTAFASNNSLKDSVNTTFTS